MTNLLTFFIHQMSSYAYWVADRWENPQPGRSKSALANVFRGFLVAFQSIMITT